MATIELIISSFYYVIRAPYFWESMGFTTAIAMFIGAVIYDGEIPRAKRGLMSVGAYAGMLIWTTLARTIPIYITKSQYSGKVKQNLPQIFANPITIILLSIFWLLGIYIGVCIIARQHKKK